MRIAVEGCGHGALHAIYGSVSSACRQKKWDGIDLLIICGDFQAVRNPADLQAMAVPAKYRQLGDFHEYYSGRRKAPYLTIFVGGNHEASNHLLELYFGGWVAPNIYYLGAANVLRCGPLRIAGLSGIWKGHDYRKPHHERLPFDSNALRSIYHVREIDVRKLLQIKTQVDVGISHDWPQGIEWAGDWKALFARKGFFEADALNGNLGSVAAKLIMTRLRPPLWFSAHMHVKFAAVVHHELEQSRIGSEGKGELSDKMAGESEPKQSQPEKNADEIDVDLDDLDDGASQPANDTKVAPKVVPDDIRSRLPESFRKPQVAPSVENQTIPEGITNKQTKFLALDKCLPRRRFLQLLEIPSASEEASSSPMARPFKLQYDREWLAITRTFAESHAIGDSSWRPPPDKGFQHYASLIDAELKWVDENLSAPGQLEVPENFEITAPPSTATYTQRPEEYTNLQTVTFCNMLQIPNPCLPK